VLKEKRECRSESEAFPLFAPGALCLARDLTTRGFVISFALRRVWREPP